MFNPRMTARTFKQVALIWPEAYPLKLQALGMLIFFRHIAHVTPKVEKSVMLLRGKEGTNQFFGGLLGRLLTALNPKALLKEPENPIIGHDAGSVRIPHGSTMPLLSYLLKTQNLYRLVGVNMAYMSEKDENFPRLLGVLRGKSLMEAGLPFYLMYGYDFCWFREPPECQSKFHVHPWGYPNHIKLADIKAWSSILQMLNTWGGLVLSTSSNLAGAQQGMRE